MQTRYLTLLTLTLILMAIYGCRSYTAPPPAESGQTHADYVVFGLSVFCPATDSRCLGDQFNRSLGQTRKQHIRENGRPQQLTLFTNGDAVAEWRFRGSGDHVTITYDSGGIARKWRYEGSWGAVSGPVLRRTSPTVPYQGPSEKSPQ